MREADTFIRHFRGKRGRGAGGETIVFGILKRGDKVYTEIVPDASKATLQKVIRGLSVSGVSSIPTVGAVIRDWLTWVLPNISGYIMVTMSLFAVRGILTVLNLFGATPSITSKHTFYLHLKETVFRFNHRHDDLYKILLRMLRENPLNKFGADVD